MSPVTPNPISWENPEPLITLEQLKHALGIDLTDTSRDARLSQAIDNASAAIETYTDRDFATTEVVETRTFSYDGSGVLDIDDCEAGSITAVSIDGVAQNSTAWMAQPDRRTPVHYWLQLTPYGGISPEMGFTYNLDTLYGKTRWRPRVVTVTARWGWPVVPADVQQAALWTAAALAESPKPYISQSFESYSVSLETPLVDAIPARARALLDPYQRIRL